MGFGEFECCLVPDGKTIAVTVHATDEVCSTFSNDIKVGGEISVYSL